MTAANLLKFFQLISSNQLKASRAHHIKKLYEVEKVKESVPKLKKSTRKYVKNLESVPKVETFRLKIKLLE